jgi:hypothetical protein
MGERKRNGHAGDRIAPEKVLGVPDKDLGVAGTARLKPFTFPGAGGHDVKEDAGGLGRIQVDSGQGHLEGLRAAAFTPVGWG